MCNKLQLFNRHNSSSCITSFQKGDAEQTQNHVETLDKTHEDKDGAQNKSVKGNNAESEGSITSGISPGEDVKELKHNSPNANDDSEPLQPEEEYDIELINRRRQEEKELFQKLIDDVTRLEHEKLKLTNDLNELNMKNNVVTIELDSERDRCKELVSTYFCN